jgi:hypothetical protein
LALLFTLHFTSAGTLNGLNFLISCGGFTSNGGSISLDRNNTGLNREVIVISATDGAGNFIFAPAEDSFLIGSTLTIPSGTVYSWIRQPEANPITLRIVSPEGNGFEEQVLFSTTGDCTNLGEATPTGPTDGVTGPSVPLNAEAPRPLNDPNFVEDLEGYAIVNTDNLFVRTGDSTAYTVVAIVDGGTRLIVLGRNRDNSWFYVQAGELRGWVNNIHVTVRGDLTNIPIVEPLGEIRPPSFFVFFENPLRIAPRANAAVVCNIAGDLEYLIVGRNAARTWYQIEATCIGGTTATGWIPVDKGAVRNPARLSAPVTG